MFTEDVLENYADVLLWGLGVARREPFKKSDVVLVRFDAPALPLAETLVEKLHERGQVPLLRLEPTPRMERAFYLQGNRKRLLFEPPGEIELYQNLAGAVRCIAPMAFGHLDDIDPEYFSIAQQGRRRLLQILAAREQAGLYSWTLGVYPTQALADEAGMSLDAYARAIQKACLLFGGSPVLAWKLLRKEMQALTDRLNALDLRTLRVQSASMDLLLTLGEQRKWVCISGRNIPSFEIYVSPDWRGTEGVFYADFPMRRNGRLVEDMRLEFRQGEAVSCAAKTGLDYALSQLGADAGANKLGEFALVDKRFSKIDAFLANPLFDENYSGPHGGCHIALGQSYLNTCALPQEQLDADRIKNLGFNLSSLHWDLVNTEEKRVFGTRANRDKICIYENGQFTV